MNQRSSQAVGRRELTIAICGNPNCGKTTLFNALTGMNQRVGNYPGVTVEKTTGSFEVPDRGDLKFSLIDIPGSYSLSAFSPDEYVATRVLCGDIEGDVQPDIVLCVIDASNLERGLYLLLQVAEVGRPIVVALNMIDLAERHGTQLDIKQLSDRLKGIPVVPVVASREQGIRTLKTVLAEVADAPVSTRLTAYDELTRKAVESLAADVVDHKRTPAQYYRIIFDCGGPAEKAFLEAEGENRLARIEEHRQNIIREYGALSSGETYPLTRCATEIAQAVVCKSSEQAVTRSERIDRFLLHPLLGPLFLGTVMVFMFQSVFSWAEPVMDLIGGLFGSLGHYVQGGMVAGPLRSLVVDGLIGGVGSVLVFLPQIVILFFFIALLEDSGYMPRAAFLVDRLFGWCGLSGKSFVPMLSSFACAVPGIMATRTIENRKLRIMTIMVAPLMSCSARLPVYTIMIAAFIPHATILGIFNARGLVLTGLYALGLITAVAVSFLLNRLLFRQERATFMMDMPSYTLPTPRSVFIRINSRAKSFVVRAGTVILAITVVIWALSYYPRSEAVENAFAARTTEIQERYAVARQTAEASSQASFVQAERIELSRLAHEQSGANLRNSYFGRVGRQIAPAFEPLGWDWKITMATLASFPAREVIIATLGTIYNLGTEEDESSASLADKMKQDRWESGARIGTPVYSPAVALSIMVFFALCAQCGATLVTIKQETAAWRYSVAAFVYMTGLAYLFAFVTYQLFSRVGI
jgi:ferrous iron transport protein B